MTLSSEGSVLIVEDDEPKLRAISKFFSDNFSGCKVGESKSLTSAIKSLSEMDFDLVVIDMSLPTYDMDETTMGGGNPQGFGGEDVVRFISAGSTNTEMVVVTQYDVFQDGDGGASRSLGDIEESLAAEIGSNFLGVVFYSGQHGDWQISLLDMLKRSGGA